jgi:hypothetical protein
MGENPVDQPSAPPPVAPVEKAVQANPRNLELITTQVVKEFDPSHHLAKLTLSWAGFMAGVVTFDEKFKVSTWPNLLYMRI